MSTPIRCWVRAHDERWSFILLYVGGAVLLSVYANLFWVVMLLIGHYALEVWRHVIIEVKNPLLQALWHVKLDIALVLFALVIALYAHLVLAALGLGQAARGVQMVSRFAVIERGLRIFFMTVDDIARVGQIVWKAASRQKNQKAESGGVFEQEMEVAREEIRKEDVAHGRFSWRRLSGGDVFSLGFEGLCLILIISSPLLAGLDVAEAAEIILQELKP